MISIANIPFLCKCEPYLRECEDKISPASSNSARTRQTLANAVSMEPIVCEHDISHVNVESNRPSTKNTLHEREAHWYMLKPSNSNITKMIRNYHESHQRPPWPCPVIPRSSKNIIQTYLKDWNIMNSSETKFRRSKLSTFKPSNFTEHFRIIHKHLESQLNFAHKFQSTKLTYTMSQNHNRSPIALNSTPGQIYELSNSSNCQLSSNRVKTF